MHIIKIVSFFVCVYVFRNLSHLLNCEDDLEELFSLNFVWHKEVFGETIVVPLMNDGENIAVTQSNK